MKNVVVLSTFRPLHGKTIDDGKEKSQIIKFYNFTKGERLLYHHINVLPLGYGSSIVYLGYS